jgi:tetrahedral aminopeptidase
MIDLLPFLKSLVPVPGVSGFENPICKSVSEAWRPVVDELSISRLGSLHGVCFGNGPQPRHRLMFAAHMDTIGLMVTGIVDGLLSVTAIGGIDVRVLPGQLVTVHARQDLPAVIVQPPVGLLPSEFKSNPVAMEYLWVDTALLSSQVAELVKVGDPISFAQPVLELTGETLCAPYLDNRASLAAMTLCLDELHGRTHAWDVWAVASVQEEIGVRGAYTSTFQLHPDVAVAIDVTFARNPVGNDWGTFQLGKGVTLGWGANIHPALFKKFKEIANQVEIPFEVEVMPYYSGTDGEAMQVTAEGIPTMVICIPLRYMHTPVEVVSLKDLRRAGRLMAEFACQLEPDFIEKITWDE